MMNHKCNTINKGEDSMGRRVHPQKRSVSWVNSVLRQFLPNGSRVFPLFILLVTIGLSYASIFLSFYGLYVSSLLYTLLFPLLRLVFLQLLASQQTSVNSWRSSDRSISTFPFLLSSSFLYLTFGGINFLSIRCQPVCCSSFSSLSLLSLEQQS